MEKKKRLLRKRQVGAPSRNEPLVLPEISGKLTEVREPAPADEIKG